LKVDRNYDFNLRVRFRLRTLARRFISALRSSGVRFAQEALPPTLPIFLRSDFETHFQRLRPAALSLARGITITSSDLLFLLFLLFLVNFTLPILVNFFI
jgi:hypothetical protein